MISKNNIDIPKLKSLGFKNFDIENVTIGELFVKELPNKWELEIDSIDGSGYLFPPNCEDFGKRVPLFFKTFEQLTGFIEAFQ